MIELIIFLALLFAGIGYWLYKRNKHKPVEEVKDAPMVTLNAKIMQMKSKGLKQGSGFEVFIISEKEYKATSEVDFKFWMLSRFEDQSEDFPEITINGKGLYEFTYSGKHIFLLIVESTSQLIIPKKEISILILGDSHSWGGITSDDNGTKISEDTLFQVHGTRIITGTKYFGFYGKWAEKVKELTGAKTIILNAAEGGSTYASKDSSKSWGEGDMLYKKKTALAKSFLQATGKKFDLIFLAIGGTDFRSGFPIEEVIHDMNWVVSQLKKDFPDTTILLSKSPAPDSWGELAKQIREAEDEIIAGDPDIHEAYDYAHLIDTIPLSKLTTDGLHLKQEYSDIVGEENGKIVAELIKRNKL